MGKAKVAPRSADRAAAANLATELRALEEMTVGQLGEKYRLVFGEPTRTRNKEYLRKRIAWALQERVEGGLSRFALARIEQLAPEAPTRWRQPRSERTVAPIVVSTTPRDPRLPPVGTVLRRLHQGIEHQVVVLEEGFEFCGEHHRSLSKIARLITGTPWNGFLFFFGRAASLSNGAEERAE